MKKIIQTAFILMTTFIGLIALYHSSVNDYFEQTYHRESPLVSVKKAFQNRFFKQDKIVDNKIDDSKSNQYVELLLKGQLFHYPNINSLRKQYWSPRPQVFANLINMTNNQQVLEEFDDLSPIIIKDKQKVFFAGDSLMQGIAPRVMHILRKEHKIEGIDLSKQSTGLTYTRFFDWPKTVRETLQVDTDIKVMIVSLGPNDPSNIYDSINEKLLKFGSESWEALYRGRIKSLLKAAKESRVRVIWVAAPCMRKKDLNEDIAYLNELYEDEVLKMNGIFIPVNELLGCSTEKYSPYAVKDNKTIKVRTNDGIHLTVSGQKLLAKRIMEELTFEEKDEIKNNDIATEKN